MALLGRQRRRQGWPRENHAPEPNPQTTRDPDEVATERVRPPGQL